MPPDPELVTVLLNDAAAGNTTATARLVELVYDQLRALAGSYTGGRQSNQTLHATALVNEAFIKLVQTPGATYNDRGHFFAVAATAMRQILTDHARAKRAQKRGGGAAFNMGDPANFPTVSIDSGSANGEFDMVALDDVLTLLEKENPRAYRVVELRFFGGLSVDDVARLLGISRSTVEADWRSARAWLAVQLGH